MNEENVITAPETVDTVPGEEVVAEGEVIIEETGADETSGSTVTDDLQSEDGELSPTVSGGDSIDLSELTILLEENNRMMQELTECEVKETASIWEKPLSDYTVTEGILLIILFLCLFVFIYRAVEGVIKW